MEIDVAWARDLACELLAEELPRRWAHSQGVARQACALAPQLGEHAALVEASAWLHDIGYASSLAVTGLHALDGARYLRDACSSDVVLTELVAHHSCAAIEAEERGLFAILLDEFGAPGRHGLLLDALTACDMTTSPDGSSESVEARLAEIMDRYDAGSPVFRAIQRSHSALVDSVARFPLLTPEAAGRRAGPDGTSR